ncbi:hypothetical protein [Candidatus Tisiphia endosymbiont of Melanophora roralis]
MNYIGILIKNQGFYRICKSWSSENRKTLNFGHYDAMSITKFSKVAPKC